MATTTSTRAKKSKKKAPKTAPKPQTLLIRALSPESLVAIDQAKAECGRSSNTAAAAYMMEDYWHVRDNLFKANQEIRKLEQRMERVYRAIRMQREAAEILVEEGLAE